MSTVDTSTEAVERLCNDIDDPFTTGMDRLELVGVIRALAAERDELAQKLTAMSAERDEYRRMSGGYYNEAATAYEQRDEARRALTAEAEHAAQLRKALIAARSHIDNLHGEIGRRTYQQEELEVTTAFDGLGDGQFNGDWASIMGIIDAAMEKANG